MIRQKHTIKNVLKHIFSTTLCVCLYLGHAQAERFLVTTTADNGAGSLRQAILDSNQTLEVNEIRFAILDAATRAERVRTIRLETALPAITQTVNINGESQAAALATRQTKPGEILIVIDGSQITSSTQELAQDDIAGIYLDTGSDGSRVSGLSLVGFTGPLAQAESNNSETTGAGLIVASNNNQILNTWIGLAPDPALELPNTTGLIIFGSNNTIGEAGSTLPVVVSNNINAGIQIIAFTSTSRDQVQIQVQPTRNTILATHIGTDVLGLAARGNGDGLHVQGTENTIGAGTLISGNHGTAVELVGDANIMHQVTIGPDITGHALLPGATQQKGIVVHGGSNLLCSCHVADNREGGIFLEESSRNALLAGNFIGMSGSGTNGLGFQRVGVHLHGDNHTIGGSTREAANLISGHAEDGIRHIDGEHTIGNNLIGTDITGCIPVPNGDNGIHVINDLARSREAENRNPRSTRLLVTANLISGNDADGIRIERGTALITDNIIGLNSAETAALPNKNQGIATKNECEAILVSNRIACNGEGRAHGHCGVDVTLPARTAVLLTPCYANHGNGIQISDTGNEDYPALTAAPAPPRLTSALSFGSVITLKGHLEDVQPGEIYRVEFFKNSTNEPFVTEGTELLGVLETLEVDAAGRAEFSVVIESHPFCTPFIAATATLLAPEGNELLRPINTSEFSANIAVSG